MILATFKSVNNSSCSMWEQQSKPSDLGWTGLHPDLGAARLGLDLPGLARILVLDANVHSLRLLEDADRTSH